MYGDIDRQLTMIIDGKVKFTATTLGLNLLIPRLQNKYRANPNADEMEKCLKEMYAFLDKYGNVMRSDYEQIKKF